MLEVVEMHRVDGAIHSELEVRGVEKLDAHVGEGADEEHVQLQIARLAAKPPSRVPHARAKRLGIHHIVDDRVGDVPQSDEQKHGARQHMALE